MLFYVHKPEANDMTDTKPTTITLWRDNKIDAEWKCELETIVTKFLQYNSRHQLDEHWPLERIIRAFLTDKETDGGLQSVFDESDYETIDDACRSAWRDAYDARESTGSL